MKKIINISLISSALIISNMAFASTEIAITCPTLNEAIGAVNQVVTQPNQSIPQAFQTSIENRSYTVKVGGYSPRTVSPLSQSTAFSGAQVICDDAYCSNPGSGYLQVKNLVCNYDDAPNARVTFSLETSLSQSAILLRPNQYDFWDLSGVNQGSPVFCQENGAGGNVNNCPLDYWTA